MVFSEPDLKKYAIELGTPLMIIDHEVIRQNYERFTKLLPRVQPYYAVKANPEPKIIKTLQKLGAGFDIASWEEYMLVYKNLLRTKIPKKKFMETKVIYANPVKKLDSLRMMNAFTMWMTFDNFAELDKIKKLCPQAKLILRVDVPNEGSLVELSSKFGAEQSICIDLMKYAKKLDLDVRGLSFHAGSQCNNVNNFINAFRICREIFDEAEKIGFNLKILDIGGGYPAPYDENSLSFEELAKVIQTQIDMHFSSPDIKIIAEPGRFLVATSATSIVEINGKAIRRGKPIYYVNDGVYGTFSGTIFDHIQYDFHSFKTDTNLTPSIVAGPTCDALDKIIMDNPLPDLDIGDFLYSKNTGAYTNASASRFNGFLPAKIVHINSKFNSFEN